MNAMQNFIKKYWPKKTDATSATPHEEVFNKIKAYFPVQEWIIDLLEQLLIHKIDIEKALQTQWGDVDLQNNTLYLHSIHGEKKPIPLCKEFKELLQTNRESQYIFQGLDDFTEKIGLASYFATGLYASELNDFYKGIKVDSSTNGNSVPTIVEKTRALLLNGNMKNKNQYPLPPSELRYRISGCDDEIIYRRNGALLYLQIMQVLKENSHYDQKEFLLDWGCGCGRIANHFFSERKEVPYYGCDIDAEAIEWCNNHIKSEHFFVSKTLPPLPFEDQKFTTIFGTSVMTHINQKDQKVWLKELHRTLQPNGLLILSVIDEDNVLCPDDLRTKAIEKGILDDSLDPALDGIAPDGYYKDVYQSKAYTLNHWTDYFEIITYEKGGLIGTQDLVIMRKKAHE